MATIVITDLRPAGVDLFIDSESFFNELNSEELGNVNGGLTPTVTASSPGCGAIISAGAAAFGIGLGILAKKIL